MHHTIDMNTWIQKFHFNPTTPLSNSSNLAIQYFYQKNILGETDIKLEDIWQLKEPQSIVRRQQENGSWKYPGKHSSQWSRVDYDQYETYLQISYLVEKYGFTKEHSAISKAFDFFITHQDTVGDIRGIYANQYSPNYTAAIIELFIKAGYHNDKRIDKALN